MDTGVVVALVTAAGLVGAGVTGTAVAHVLGRQMRAAQIRQAEAQTKAQEAQAEQLRADADRIRQDVYQQLTQDLRTELESVKKALALTSAEAERLRGRVVELESRVAQLEQTERHLSAELQVAQAERDQLRIQLAGRDATITALTAQIGDLKTHLASQQGAYSS